jgi:hypothetical protein
MNFRHRFSRMPSKPGIVLAAIFSCALVSESHAQFAWAKELGISGTTVWKAAAMDKDGGLYFGGVSDKLPGTPTRGFVMAKYDATAAAKWNTKILGGTGAYAGQTCVAVDTAGNSFMLDKFSTTPLKLPDGTEISYFLPCYFVSKYLPNGDLAWCKRLVVPGIGRFQATPDGTLGILATGIGKTYIFGNDTIASPPDIGGDTFIEVKPDGSIGRSVAAGSISEFSFIFSQWIEPGKVFAVGSEVKNAGNTLFHRGILNLETKTFTEEGAPLSVVAAPYSFRWQNDGFPNSPTTVWEPKSGHLFVLMAGVQGTPVLNATDTLIQQTNSQILDGYVVELDDQMRVVRKVHMTNPVQLAVRDSQVVVTAIVRGSADVGFTAPDTTIKITRKQYNMDGYVVYVMDRNFRRLRHAMVEGTYQTSLNPYATSIREDGGIYFSLDAGGDLYFEGMPVMTRGRFTGTLVAMLAGKGAVASIAKPAKSIEARIHLNQAGTELLMVRPGSYRYSLTNIRGERFATGEGSGRSMYDMSRVPQGMYFLTLRGQGATSSHIIRKLDP